MEPFTFSTCDGRSHKKKIKNYAAKKASFETKLFSNGQSIDFIFPESISDLLAKPNSTQHHKHLS